MFGVKFWVVLPPNTGLKDLCSKRFFTHYSLLITHYSFINVFVQRTAVVEIARGWKNDPDTFPLLQQLAQYDKDGDMRRAAVEEIAFGWKDEPWVLEFLRDRVLNDPFERQFSWETNPRQSALEIIIEFRIEN